MKNVYGWMVWMVASLFVIYAFCLDTSAAVFASSIKSSLQLTDIEYSYATAVFVFGYALLQIPAGYLMDHYNSRWVVGMGIFFLALGNFLSAHTTVFGFLIFSNLIEGIGSSFAFIAVAVLISNWFPIRLFPILFGLTQTLSCLLAGVIHYVFMEALEVYHWSMIYQYLSIFGFFLFLLAILIVYSPAKEKKGQEVSLIGSLRMVLKDKQIWLLSFAAATTFGVLLAYGSLWYENIQNFYQVSRSDSLIISGLIFAGIGVGTPVLGYLSNLCQSRTMVIHLSLVLGNMALILGIYLPHYSFASLVLIKIVSFFIGFFLSGSMLFFTIASEISTDDTRGVAISVVNTLAFLFNSLLVFLPFWFMTAQSHLFFTYLWIFPFSVMSSLIFLYFIKDSYSVATKGETPR